MAEVNQEHERVKVMDNQQLELFTNVVQDECCLHLGQFMTDDRLDENVLSLDISSHANVVHCLENYRKEKRVTHFDSSLLDSIVSRAKLF